MEIRLLQIFQKGSFDITSTSPTWIFQYNMKMGKSVSAPESNKFQFLGLTGSSIIAMSLNFLTGVLIASSLGPLGRGLYQVIKNFQALIPSLLSLSLGSIYSSKEDSKNLGLSKYKYHILISWIISIFILFLTPYYKDISAPSIYWIGLSFPFFFTSNLITAYFIRNNDSVNYLRYYVITNIGTPILIVLSHILDTITIENLVLSLIIPNFANFALSIKHVITNEKNIQSIYKLKKNIALVHFSNFSRILISSFDQMIIVATVGIEKLGIYMVAYSFTSIFSVITGPSISMVPVWGKNSNIFKY